MINNKKLKLGKGTESKEGEITILYRGARDYNGKVIFE